ncbi:endoribonuclease ZC3H12A [Nerophis ophidion]|uniref:endoribonuclease ZC3H12A n=1 Tax=Nerophis ophidion TaxID=159077 RepID=UPI002ADFFBA2|nr:endoribonuclease ZC3H12A [Nerophis ophidion]XP_061737502.1 endoribonuclease ZC3H12A [Nerophis ophidion]XP_061737503.1 endoribonuclease ZC3H12A [Nerophis ophidion]XP_061737505.1 endoribonuclease ZC3H12A [Nerophis ophidion]XP_061737506.1 endoribonuclease ZC3H12A [Nerophis ophidion]XP_061737507.1 endoribonuclease ZC3H12A [Nerophis ophidion]
METRPPDEPDEAQLDFFHKLGYSTAQVTAVLRKFGSGVDTDKVLGELVGMRAEPLAERAPVTTVSVLVTKGDGRYAEPTVMLPLASSPSQEEEDVLRNIVIDGSNVAMSHGNKEVFSCLGIQLAVDFFLHQGHTKVTVFVPSWRKEQPRPDVPISDQRILEELEKKKHLTFTPSRRVGGRRVVCNDDFFIVKMAYDEDGVIVSNDLYRDLKADKPEWKRFIEARLLMYTFVNDKFMVPDDPLGRYGPNLKNFLRKFPKTQKTPLCPYGRKCTFGLKCRFQHPERAKQSTLSLATELRENTKKLPWCKSLDGGLVPGESLLLIESMARNLTLGPEKGSLKKDTQVKAGPCTRQQVSLSASHKQLDSGVGSLDSQYGATSGSYQPMHPGSAPMSPCLCCPHASWTSFHQVPARHHMVRSDLPPYSHGAHFQHAHQMYWTDPVRHGAPAPSFPGAHSPREPRHRPTTSNPNSEERKVMRKKLLAIYSAYLVDAAMEMFPHVVDPQMLVAEIVRMQSHSHRYSHTCQPSRISRETPEIQRLSRKPPGTNFLTKISQNSGRGHAPSNSMLT